jgi:carboxyl-terminal processing protease
VVRYISCFFLLTSVAFSQSDANPCETLSQIDKLIKYNHYKVKPVDDSLSVYTFKTFVSTLDEDARLFLEPEVSALKKHEFKIDDYINQKECGFLEEFYEKYTAAVNRYEKVINEIIREPFAFNRNDTIQFSKKNFPNPKDEAELKKILQKSTLFYVLKDIAEMSKNKDSLIQNFESLAPLAKEKVLESYQCKTDSYRLSKNDFYAAFYNSYCSYFDPHTNYLSQSDRSSFLSGLSADNLTFGIYVSLNQKNEIVVDAVIPGSSAYSTHKIDPSDIITKVKFDNKEYRVACSSLKKFEEVFTSNKIKKADLTFRKKTGEIITVQLVKKVMKNYENNVYSYVLNSENSKIGYIRIPSFYSNYEDGTSNVSDDVVKELYKLKADKIDGLILDLENNGGGSMEEAKRLTGMFIDIGPIAVLKNSLGKNEIVKDYNRGSVFSGPIVVMVNGSSASASEFFANAMQDYKRGIIIGNQTHGKASMQRIFPLTNDHNSAAYVKITIEKFYRVTGESNQTNGITPNVEIPTLFDNQMPREKDYDTALPNEKIETKFKFQTETTDFSSVIEKSAIRLKENPAIQSIAKLNSKINDLYDNNVSPIRLQFANVFDEVSKVNMLWKEITDFSEIEYPIQVSNSSMNEEYQQFDEFLKSSSVEKIKAIKQNIHIVEGLHILNDLKNN